MKLALTLVIGAVLGIIGMVTAEDHLARAPAEEKLQCLDTPDTTAWMARLPSEPHTIETCIQVRKFSDPTWIPSLGVVLGSKGVPGKLGREQQLRYVRIECRKLAKQLKQRC